MLPLFTWPLLFGPSNDSPSLTGVGGPALSYSAPSFASREACSASDSARALLIIVGSCLLRALMNQFEIWSFLPLASVLI